MKQEILDLIHDNTYCDYSTNVASEDEINNFVKRSKMELDPEYLNFLKNINGFELNGTNFYGTKEQEDIYVLDALKQNGFWIEEIPGLKNYFILGDGDIDFYCQSLDGSQYFILNKGGLEKCGEFDSFNALVENIIETII